jgi:phosphoribosyl-ATP pyrophosphohydrolase/phosphoribosyl-AMP cyclohydrolase
MNPGDLDRLDWAKGDGLLPAVVQDAASGAVLMLGYMNREALAQTLATGRVTFYSRSRRALWVKGETSGNWLQLRSLGPDCDGDAILVQAAPEGPTCHAGTPSCFATVPAPGAMQLGFLAKLEAVIAARIAEPRDASYTARLHAGGLRRVAQKVGEEGLELARRFGSQCVVVGIDSRGESGRWRVHQYAGDPGRIRDAGRDMLDWVVEVQERGAGEIVLNCMEQDGARAGYDIPQLAAAREHCDVPLVASGGAGTAADFAAVFERAGVDAALAAGAFHDGSIRIPALKRQLLDQGIAVRP